MATTKNKFSISAEQKAMLSKALKKAEPTQFIETGDVGLDLALSDGKGLPMGSSTLFWAKPGCGKTTIVTDACKRLIQAAKNRNEKFQVLYLAVEDSRSLMSALGMDEYIDSGDFIYYAQGFKWRHIETFYQAVLNGHDGYENVKLIVIDSVNNVLSEQQSEKSIADGDYGTKARERYAFYQKFLPLCKEAKISSFFIAQVRHNQAAQTKYDPSDKAAVGDGDLHNVDIILKCTALSSGIDASKIEEETIFGKDKVASKCIFKMDSKATYCKNRYTRGNTVELLFEKGKCVWNYYAVKKLLIGNNLIKDSAGWYSFDPELCATFGIPTNKMRNAEVNRTVQDHIGELIELLKQMGKYKVGLKETEVEADDESDTEEEEE